MWEEPVTVESKELFLRDSETIRCDCGGEADRVDCTEEENKKYGCGRSYECCSRAFICCICNKRIVGQAEAPEMDSD